MHKKNASTQAIDAHVGAQIRWHRMAKGLTQETLAQALGITYQQLYKYETGSNSASASRLADIATILKINVSSLFDGVNLDNAVPDTMMPAASKREHLQFLKHYMQIRSYDERKIVRDLIRVLSSSRASE
ncbi:MAG: helix-turn-helix domain-containing protein [Rickettsiales bacterium]|nr:helix-turn-helix domain-containing protein [Rickettsiales bacterium]